MTQFYTLTRAFVIRCFPILGVLAQAAFGLFLGMAAAHFFTHQLWFYSLLCLLPPILVLLQLTRLLPRTGTEPQVHADFAMLGCWLVGVLGSLLFLLTHHLQGLG